MTINMIVPRVLRYTVGFYICLMILANTVLGATVNVNNYNWLQLPAPQVTTVYGSTNNATGNGYGDGTEPRWGDFVWIPNGTATANGSQMYYAAVRLDQSRGIENVNVQWWANEGTSVSRYFIDGSNDGTSWTNVGSHNFGVAMTGTRFMQNVDVADNSWQYVRVRLEPGDYAFGSASRGGPGILAIEPIGDGTLNKSQVNWSNKPNFSTTVANNGLGFNGLRYNDGLLFDDEGTRTGNNPGNWDPGDYAQVNLGAKRLISSTNIVWDWGYAANAYDVSFSNDGSTFFPVASPSALINHGTFGGAGASEKQFDPVYAQYIRISGATTSAGYALLNQLLTFGPDDGTLTSNPGINGTLDLSAGPDNITLTNTGGVGTAIAIAGYSISGPDGALFDLTSFSEQILTSGLDASFDYQVEFLGTPGAQDFNALLTFNTSLGDFSYDLFVAAIPIPEPATFWMLGSFAVGLAMRRRRSQQAKA